MSGIYAYAGNNGLPFHTSDKTAVWGTDEWTENNYLPFGVDTETLFRWLYRVRTWDVTLTYDIGALTLPFHVRASHEAQIVVKHGVWQERHEFRIPYTEEGEPQEAFNFMKMDLFYGEASFGAIKVGDLWHISYDFDEDGGEVQPSWGDTITRTGDNSWQAAAPFRLWSWAAKDWWPYDPGDGGGPCYDEATGEKLRDTHAIQGSPA
jgi:hypothetical protein